MLILHMRTLRLRDRNLAWDPRLRFEPLSISSRLMHLLLQLLPPCGAQILHILLRSSKFTSITHPLTQQSFLWSQVKISLTFSSVQLNPLSKSSHLKNTPPCPQIIFISALILPLDCFSSLVLDNFLLSLLPPPNFSGVVSSSTEKSLG